MNVGMCGKFVERATGKKVYAYEVIEDEGWQQTPNLMVVTLSAGLDVGTKGCGEAALYSVSQFKLTHSRIE